MIDAFHPNQPVSHGSLAPGFYSVNPPQMKQAEACHPARGGLYTQRTAGKPLEQLCVCFVFHECKYLLSFSFFQPLKPTNHECIYNHLP